MKLKVKQIILAGLFAALTAVGAFIQIPLWTVPVTLQFLFTALSGVMLGGKLGALSQLVYVILGLFGLPVFAGGIGGLGTIVKPSFGYLLGFIISAYIIGRIAEGLKKVSFTGLLAAAAIGLLATYLIGVPYLYLILSRVMGSDITLAAAIKAGFLVFIPGDILKCIITAWLGTKCRKYVAVKN